MHEADDLGGHNFIRCHVKECDILSQYKRCKPGSSLSAQRWKGRSIKLEGSDHAPVYVTLHEIPNLSLHSTPSLSARYDPMVRGLQQTLVSVLTRRQVSEQMKSCKTSGLISGEDIVSWRSCERVKESFDSRGLSVMTTSECDVPSSQDSETSLESNKQSGGSSQEAVCNNLVSLGIEYDKAMPGKGTQPKKKARSSVGSQLSLMSFFKKSANVDSAESSQLDHHPNEASAVVDQSGGSKQHELCTDVCEDVSKFTDDSARKETSNVALLEWQRIQQLMQNSIPLCKGHKEPCIARVVKKQGPNFGRRFYVCARAEGPASNPEANCGYFKWATSKSRN